MRIQCNGAEGNGLIFAAYGIGILRVFRVVWRILGIIAAQFPRLTCPPTADVFDDHAGYYAEEDD